MPRTRSIARPKPCFRRPNSRSTAGAPLVERGPFRGAAFDRRFGLDAALAERDHGGDAALVALGVHLVVCRSRDPWPRTEAGSHERSRRPAAGRRTGTRSLRPSRRATRAEGTSRARSGVQASMTSSEFGAQRGAAGGNTRKRSLRERTRAAPRQRTRSSFTPTSRASPRLLRRLPELSCRSQRRRRATTASDRPWQCGRRAPRGRHSLSANGDSPARRHTTATDTRCAQA